MVNKRELMDKQKLTLNMVHSISPPPGLKPGQRKVLYTCFKRNDKREIKVAQLAGSVAEHSAYHHGEVREMPTNGLSPAFLVYMIVSVCCVLSLYTHRVVY